VREITLEIMKSIIVGYLNKNITRSQAVEQLISRIDIDFIYSLGIKYEPKNLFITDCYWSIKHLTENGFETRDEEIRKINDCINRKCIYKVDEKNKILQSYFDSRDEEN
jgi:hypothetical protein